MIRFFTALLFCIGISVNAQPFYKHFDLGITLGSSHYSGEIANQSSFQSLTKEFRMQTGLHLNYFLSDNFSLGVESTFGRWYASDFNHKNLFSRNFYGESNYLYLGVIYTQRFFAARKTKVIPHIAAGFGANFYHTKIYGTEGSALQPNEDQANSSSTDPAVSLSAGLSYRLDKNISIGLEAWLSLHPLDMVDNLAYGSVESDKIGSIRLTFNYKLIRLH